MSDATKHTPGPYIARGNGIHSGIQCVATTHAEQRHADAARIAACLNACEGIPTEKLVGPVVTRNFVQHVTARMVMLTDLRESESDRLIDVAGRLDAYMNDPEFREAATALVASMGTAFDAARARAGEIAQSSPPAPMTRAEEAEDPRR